MNLPQQPVHNFTWKAKDFADKESFEKSLRFDDDGNLCSDKNSLRFAAIRPGMYVAACQANPEITPRYNFDMDAVPVIGFAFHLSGKLECTRQMGAGGKRLESPCISVEMLPYFICIEQRAIASIYPVKY